MEKCRVPGEYGHKEPDQVLEKPEKKLYLSWIWGLSRN